MNSEFYNVALDRIRYSLVWEDSRTLYQALAIAPTDHVLLITSAGCNVLNALLQQPRRVTAIDLNPVQNKLLLFKCHLILRYEFGVLRALLGLEGKPSVAHTWSKIADSLPTEMRDYWAAFFESHPGGILTAGKLESYITGFLPSLDEETQQKVRRLTGFDTVAAQRDFFANELDGTAFQARFTSYFDEASLSKGRDPALFKYAQESGGEAFYARLKDMVSTKLVRDNFFFRFFFFGPKGLPEAILPPSYQRRHHQLLRQQLAKLTVVTGEAVSYLESAAGRTVTKASLSNIFEYASPTEFWQVSKRLFAAADRPLRLVFWNLLQNQGDIASASARLPLNKALSELLSGQDACFYFRNVRVLDSKLLAVSVSSASSLTPVMKLTTPDYCSIDFLEQMMQAHAPHKIIRVRAVAPLPIDNSASILVTLTAGQTDKAIGHFGLAVTLEVNGEAQVRHLVLKVKPNGREISAMLASLAQACGGQLAAVYPEFATLTGFEHTHRRELEVCQQHASDLMPTIWGVYADDEQKIYCVLLEYLEDVTLLNSVMTPAAWTDEHIRAALEQLAAWHARHLVTQAPQAVGPWDDLHSCAYMTQLSPLWGALLTNAATHFPDLYPESCVQALRTAIDQIPAYWGMLNGFKTLIHNDLNPRNTCFKLVDNKLRLCAYDWELATYHVPQYDVVELLCFVLEDDRYHLRATYLEHYRQVLHVLTGRYADASEFREVAGYAALDFGLHRLGMYLMAHTVSPYPFLPRVVNSYFDTLALLQPLTRREVFAE